MSIRFQLLSGKTDTHLTHCHTDLKTQFLFDYAPAFPLRGQEKGLLLTHLWKAKDSSFFEVTHYFFTTSLEVGQSVLK